MYEMIRGDIRSSKGKDGSRVRVILATLRMRNKSSIVLKS